MSPATHIMSEKIRLRIEVQAHGKRTEERLVRCDKKPIQ